MRNYFYALRAQRPLLAVLVGVCPVVPALAAAPPPPNAGTILQQAQPTPPPAPSSNNNGLSVEQAKTGSTPSSVPFHVARIEISGNTRIETSILQGLVASAEGRSVTLPELVALAGRITDYYHAHGYPLARAIIPAQTMREGVVHIEVIEAHYGKVSVNNQSGVRTGLLESTLDDLKSGAVVTQAQLDRGLLLLSDIPGLQVNAALRPGAEVGSSDLQVETRSPAPVIGNVTVDNSGDRYTGRARIGANVDVLELAHQGDVLGLGILSSGGNMNYGRLSYDALLNGEGTRVGVGYSALHYRLSGDLSDLDGHGTAQDGSVFVKQPLVRGRDLDLYAQIQYDHLKLNDDVDVSDIKTRRHLDDVTASLTGDARDGLLAGAVNTWAASGTYGRVGFDNAQAEATDAVSADTRGRFSKWNLTLARLQGLGANDAVYLEAGGQWTTGNLDPSQQLVLGGPTSVRAYDVSAVSGDTGWQATVELRHTYPVRWYGQWQTIAFVEDAHLTINKTVFATGPNTASLTGAGAGLNWAGPDQWTVGVTVAAPFGSRPELLGSTSSVRAWAQVSKGF